MTTPIDDLDDFAALDPFFRIIAEGLEGFVDGEHFFDLLAEDVIVDYVISVPGDPRRVAGRRAVAELYRGESRTTAAHNCLASAASRPTVKTPVRR